MTCIALIAKYSWAGISTSLINSALFWEEKGYMVDIYLERPDVKRFPFPDFHGKNIRIIKTFLNFAPPADDLFFYANCFDRSSNYRWLIAFDVDALIRAGVCHLFGGVKIIYHSLEFYEPNHIGVRAFFKKRIEKFFSKRADYIFTQDLNRIAFLENELNVARYKFRLIYNSSPGEIISLRSNYFAEKFQLSSDLRIVLCVGSLMEETRIMDIVHSVKDWDERFVLVLHGWFPDNRVSEFVRRQRDAMPGKIYISEQLLNHWDKYVPFQSCHIGFLGFSSDTNNLKYAAGSAGKLFDFLRTGRPIIAFNSPGMLELVEGNGAGLVYNTVDDIWPALQELEKSYELFRENCFRGHGRYEFNRQYANVYDECLG